MQNLAELSSLYEAKFGGENFNREPRGLYEPVKHIMANGGKKIRPMLLLMGCDMFGGDVKSALDPAFAVEVFHNFTLVHDDIMDEADIRRGRPTVHKVFGINKGILAGDVMLSYAYQYLSNVEARYLPRVLQIFNKTAIEIMEGQQLDIDFEQRNDVTVEEYLKMIEFKTSVLLAAALEIGAVIGGANQSDCEKIYQFGVNLGLSFQITDDLLDSFGAGEKVGKKIGGDIIQNKKTFLLITALKDADLSQKSKLEKLLNEKDHDLKVKVVLEIYQELNVPEKTESRAKALYNLALQSLEEISIPTENKNALFDLANKIKNRDY